MIKTEKIEINDHTYNITQFSAIEGLPIRANYKAVEQGEVQAVLTLLSKTTRDNEAITEDRLDRFYTDNYEELDMILEKVLVFNFLSKKGTGKPTEKPAQVQKETQQEN